MGRSWISASARIPFTPVRVGHTFGGGGSRRRARQQSTDSTGAGYVVFGLMFVVMLVLHPVITILVAPLVITTAIAVYAQSHPDAALSRWWIRANENIRIAKKYKTENPDDVTIVTGKE